MRKQALNTSKNTTAAKVQATAPENALFMRVAPAETTEAQPEQPEQPEQPAPAPVAEVEQPAPAPAPAPVAEVEQPAPLVVATPARVDFVPMLTPAPRSLEELLDLVRKAKSVTERLTAYKATGEKLSGFELAREGYTDRLTIKDGSGLEWSTSKSSIIQKVLDVLRTDLSAAIETTEAELRQLLPTA
jgi:hypothetical protein